VNCKETCLGYRTLGIDACQGCAGNPKPKEVELMNSETERATIKDRLLTILDPLSECRHGMLRCTCGVCTKHPMSVIVKGGHVVGTSSGSPTHINNPAFGC